MLKVNYRGHADSLKTLKASDFTRQNFGAATMTSTTVTSATPNGVLGGMVATGSTDSEVKVCTTEAPTGLFVLDSSDADYQNTPAVASGIVPVMKSQGSYEVDYYETRNEADSADLTYAVNDLLYCSQNGLITKDNSTNANVLGIVTSAPDADGFLGFDLRV